MPSGLTLPPNYAEDILYAAYRDRLLIKSLGIQAGVVGAEDYKVSAGSGLQVNVKAGNAFVEQTGAIEESSNAFYNGMYQVPNPTEQNPYNSVEVSASNPQIAQIILRVYDVGELKIGGSSYGRIEWLNGSANAGATPAHVEEGKASEYGAAVLSASSFRIAYVIIPKNATKSSEFTIIDARVPSSKFPLNLTNHSNSVVAKYNEFLLMKATAMVELPKPILNSPIGIFCSSGITTIVTNEIGVGIYGNYIEGAATVTLLKNQFLFVQASEKNWYITSGCPNLENLIVEKSYSKAEAETGIIPSETRSAFVNLIIVSVVGNAVFAEIKVAGNLAGEISSAPITAASSRSACPIWLNPGQKWTLAAGSSQVAGVEAFTKLL